MSVNCKYYPSRGIYLRNKRFFFGLRFKIRVASSDAGGNCVSVSWVLGGLFSTISCHFNLYGVRNVTANKFQPLAFRFFRRYNTAPYGDRFILNVFYMASPRFVSSTKNSSCSRGIRNSQGWLGFLGTLILAMGMLWGCCVGCRPWIFLLVVRYGFLFS